MTPDPLLPLVELGENDMSSSASLPAHAAEAAATEGVDGGFTPGPWEVAPDNPHEIRAASTPIATAWVWGDDIGGVNGEAEGEANARLIAAAPDLLAVAIAAFYREVGTGLAHRVQRNGWIWPEDAPLHVSAHAENARAAIAKALGTTERPDRTREDPNSPSGSTPLADGNEG